MIPFEQRKIVALDIGGVCILLHRDLCFREFGVTDEKAAPPEFLAACEQLEKGKISSELWLDLFQNATNHQFSKSRLLEIWNTMIGYDIPGMGQVVHEFSDRFRFVYFSNTSRLHLDEVVRKNRFGHLVSGGVFSFEAGYMKPEEEIYQIFENTYGVPVAYFDDNADNIAAASGLGWNAHLYTCPEEFAKVLRSLV